MRVKIDIIDKKVEGLRTEQSAIDTKTREILNGITDGEAKLKQR